MAVPETCETRKTREGMDKKSKNAGKVNKKVLAVAQDIKLAKVLAGNNKKLRDRALKSLKKWLKFRERSMPFTEDDFMRIWKGLFYSMWMSDKPLVQEECAENISRLVHFASPDPSLLFFKAGLKTLGNEWFGIDQLRLDKFLMFVRRLLRQALVLLNKNSWDVKVIKKHNDVLSETVLNVDEPPPVGLTTHFTEIYVEELAKIAQGEIKPHSLTELLRPFVKQLSRLKDGRQISCIKRHVFRRLMEQSDPGFEYEEKFRAWKKEGFPGGTIDSMQRQEVEDEAAGDGEAVGDGGGAVGPLDPRAGRVDVVLPQLRFSAKQIAGMLQQNKFAEGSNTKSRKAIGTLYEEFLQMSRGKYPLGIKKVDLPKRDGRSTSVRKAVNRLVKFENKLLGKTRKRKSIGEDTDPPAAKRKKAVEDEKTDFDSEMTRFIEKSEGQIRKKQAKTIDKTERVTRQNEARRRTRSDRAVAAKQPTTAAKPPATAAKPPATAAKQPPTAAKHPATATKQPSKAVKQSATAAKQPSTAAKQPSTAAKQPSTAPKQPSTAPKQPSTAPKQPSTAPKQSSTALKQPATSNKTKEGHRKASQVEETAGDKKFECSFKRNSGVWYVFNGDDTNSDSSSNNLSVISERSFEASTSPGKCTPQSGAGSPSDGLNRSPKRDSTTPKGLSVSPQSTDSQKMGDGHKASPKMSPSLPKLGTNGETPGREPSPRSPKLNGNSKLHDLLTENLENAGDWISTPVFKQDEWDVPLKDGEVEIFVPSNKYKRKSADACRPLGALRGKNRRSLDAGLVKNPFSKKLRTPGSSKKVKIDLKLNRSQEIHEHVAQIKSSPGIPFDAAKKPTKPLLKSNGINSPINPFYKKKLKL